MACGGAGWSWLGGGSVRAPPPPAIGPTLAPRAGSAAQRRGVMTPEAVTLRGPVSRLAFIRPLNPSAAVRPPKGDDWLHEPKWDGFRFQIIKDGSQVRFYSRHGAEYTDRLPGMVEAFGKMPTQSAILDGELGPDRSPRRRAFLPADGADAHERAGRKPVDIPGVRSAAPGWR